MMIHLDTLEDTKQLATQWAAQAQAGDVYLLQGDLGAGKSTFARFFIQSLCGEDTVVPSPTFTLVQSYDSAQGVIYHYDLYRLEDSTEVYELGIEENFYQGICLIEWPERMGSLSPAHAKVFHFFQTDGRRVVHCN